MRASIRLGRIAGIPVGVHWSLLVIGALLTTSLAGSLLPDVVPNTSGSYWAAAILAAALFFGSILAHELSHAVVARHYGQKVEDITLWLLGGLARLGSESPSPRAEALVALAGPATSFALGGLFFGGGHLVRAVTSDDLLAVVLIWLGAVNLLLGVFNILPGSPLDGGRVVAAALWAKSGDRRRGQIGAARAGRVLGSILIGLGLANVVFGLGVGSLWTAIVGWFIVEASRSEERAATVARALDALRLRDVMTPSPLEVPEWVTVGNLRSSTPPPPEGQHAIVLRAFDGSARATVPVDVVRRAPADIALRDLALPAIVAPPDALVLDVLQSSQLGTPIGAVIVVDGARVLGVVGRHELRSVTNGGSRVLSATS
jgi:Zn-dependent protease